MQWLIIQWIHWKAKDLSRQPYQMENWFLVWKSRSWQKSNFRSFAKVCYNRGTLFSLELQFYFLHFSLMVGIHYIACWDLMCWQRQYMFYGFWLLQVWTTLWSSTAAAQICPYNCIQSFCDRMGAFEMLVVRPKDKHIRCQSRNSSRQRWGGIWMVLSSDSLPLLVVVPLRKCMVYDHLDRHCIHGHLLHWLRWASSLWE